MSKQKDVKADEQEVDDRPLQDFFVGWTAKTPVQFPRAIVQATCPENALKAFYTANGVVQSDVAPNVGPKKDFKDLDEDDCCKVGPDGTILTKSKEADLANENHPQKFSPPPKPSEEVVKSQAKH
jgi:hypothetical protein